MRLLFVVLAFSLSLALRAQNGSPLKSFGSDGKVFTTFHTNREYSSGNAILPLPDGKTIVSVGNVLARHLPDGQLDVSYGVSGFTREFKRNDGAELIVRGAMRYGDASVVITGSLHNQGENENFVALVNPNGFLDSTFGIDGISILRGADLMYAYKLAVLPNGKLILSGICLIDSIEHFFLARLMPDGTADPSFGRSGIVSYNNSDYRFAIRDMKLYPNGAIVVAGVTPAGWGFEIRFARFLPDGSPDESFGDGGTLSVQFSGNDDLKSIAIQPDGKIVAVGSSALSNARLMLVRLLPNGRLDLQFGNGGRVQFGGGVSDIGHFYPADVIVLQNGDILVGGSYEGVASLWRFTNGGQPDFSFWGTGSLKYYRINSYVVHMAFYEDGRIGVTGQMPSKDGPNDAYFLARLGADGNPDFTFAGGAGYITGQSERGMSEYWTLAVQPDGKLLAAGTSWNSRDITTDLTLARYLPDGRLDPSFAINGKMILDIGGQDQPVSIALSHDGRILVGGTTRIEKSEMFIVCLLSDGTLDASFNRNGIKLGAFSETNGGYDEQLAKVLIQPDGKIVVAGTATIASKDEFVVFRLKQNGSLDPSFGKRAVAFGRAATAIGAALTTDGKILVGGIGQHPDFSSDFILTRFNADGSIDNQFGVGGAQRTDFGQVDLPSIMVQHSNGQIYMGGLVYNNNFDFAVAQFNNDGTPYTPFGVNGKKVFDLDGPAASTPSAVEYNIHGMDVQLDGKILIAGSKGIQGFGIARLNVDGTFDPTFNNYGYFLEKHPAGLHFRASKIIGDRFYVAGGALGVAMVAAYHLSDNWPMPAAMPASLTAPASTVQVQQNPSVTDFILNLDMKKKGSVQLQVVDASGVVVEHRQNLPATGIQRFGANYRPGIYLAEVTQGREKISVKLVKQ